MLPSRQVRLFKRLVTWGKIGSFILTIVLLSNALFKEQQPLLRQRHKEVFVTRPMTLDEVTFNEYVPFQVFFDNRQRTSELNEVVKINRSIESIYDRKKVNDKLQDSPNYSVLKRLKGFSLDIFLFSAVVTNSSRITPWDTVVLQGWEHSSFRNTHFGCCIKYESGLMVPIKLAKKIDWAYMNKTQMPVKQYVCRNPKYRAGDKPSLVTLSGSTSKTACHKLYNWYVTPAYAHDHRQEIAVCAKLVYGSIPAEDILTWFEIHRLMGVDKVLLYTYKLNPEAMKVLEYYWSLGMAEIVPFTLPRPSQSRKNVQIGVKNMQAWNDEQVPVYDCHEKLKGYKYVVTLDMDEYIIPKQHRNWMELFDKLFSATPRAAGFTFLVQLHITTWGVTNTKSNLKIGQYVNRTKAMTDRMKHVTRPERLQQGGLSTHQYSPLWEKGYKRVQAKESDAVVHHYRSCRKDWTKHNSSRCMELERFRDHTVADLVASVESDIIELKSLILTEWSNSSGVL